jgi:hypothetical protein
MGKEKKTQIRIRMKIGLTKWKMTLTKLEICEFIGSN